MQRIKDSFKLPKLSFFLHFSQNPIFLEHLAEEAIVYHVDCYQKLINFVKNII